MRYLMLFVGFILIQSVGGVLMAMLITQSLPSIKAWKSFDEKEFFRNMNH